MELFDIFCDDYIEYKYSIKDIFIVQRPLFYREVWPYQKPQERGDRKIAEG